MDLWSTVAPILSTGQHLTYEQSRGLMTAIMSGGLDEIKLAAFLSMVAVRGVSVEELQGLADQMQASAEQIELPAASVDIVGTGGDGAQTVNISTMAAIVIAAAGFPVVKHGNRASTSACGSADLLEALGVDLNASPRHIRDSFAATGIAFLFANKFHPSMRHAARVRRELGFPTAFNILGPLTNPVHPIASAVGVARPEAAPLVAGVFANRGTSAFVFRGTRVGLDELSTVEPAHLWAVREGRILELDMDPAQLLGLRQSRLEELRGGDAAQNAKIAQAVLSGAPGPVAEAVALNAAVGMMAGAAAGVATPLDGGSPVFDSVNWTDPKAVLSGIKSGFEFALETLESGAAEQTLNRWVTESKERALTANE